MNPNGSFSSSHREGETKRGWEEVGSQDGEQEVRPQLSISYDSLSKEVKSYADNLEAQVWAVFAKYGIVVGEGVLHPPTRAGTSPTPTSWMS